MKHCRLPTLVSRRIALIVLFVLFLAVTGQFSFYIYSLNTLINDSFPLCQSGLPGQEPQGYFLQESHSVGRMYNPRAGGGIYARSLEMQVGDHFAPDDLELELQLLHYRKRRGVDGSGSYWREGNSFSIHRRSERAGSQENPWKIIRIIFEGRKITSMVDFSSGQDLSSVRLEPLYLGEVSALYSRNRECIDLQEVPELLKKTVLAVEDQNFYGHHGADFKGVMRALCRNIQKGSVVQGGSTVTQQLVRYLFFSQEQTITRKLDETVMAYLLEMRFSKEEILESYINEIYLGQEGQRSITGFPVGAKYYFGKNLKEINYHEIALLVGLLKGPSYYNPFKFPERAKGRRNLVLQVMQQENVISHDQATMAAELDVDLRVPMKRKKYPAVVDLVKRQYKELLASQAEKGEKRVPTAPTLFTSWDPIVQHKVEEGIDEGVNRIEKRVGKKIDDLEIGVVVISRPEGKVLAVVGGRDYRFPGFNRAINIRRPIGSLIKPVYFLAALERPERYNVMTVLDNSPLTMEVGQAERWSPGNYSLEDQGEVKLYQALAHSYNTASIRLGLDLGLQQCLEYLKRLGFERKLPVYPSTLLGTVSMSPLEVAGIYASFASGGMYSPISILDSVSDGNEAKVRIISQKRERRASEAATFILNFILQKAVTEGTIDTRTFRASYALHAAGKTGTTDDLRDNWFAGYTGDMLAVVWVGKDTNKPAHLTGAQGAYVIWDEIMSRISKAPLKPHVPENIAWQRIEPTTGGAIKESECEIGQILPFTSGFEPHQLLSCNEAKQLGNHKGKFNQWLHGM